MNADLIQLFYQAMTLRERCIYFLAHVKDNDMIDDSILQAIVYSDVLEHLNGRFNVQKAYEFAVRFNRLESYKWLRKHYPSHKKEKVLLKLAVNSCSVDIIPLFGN